MKIIHLVGAIGTCIYTLLFATAIDAAIKPIASMNITAGTVVWIAPGGGPPQFINITTIGANTDLVGGYIGVGASTSGPFDPPDPDNISIFPVSGGSNFGLTYTAASNLGASNTPAGSIPGGPVPFGTLDGILNTIDMNLSSWFGNLNNATDIWSGSGDLNDGFTSLVASGTWNPATFEYELTWNSRTPDGPFAGLMATWTLTGYAYPVTATTITIDIKPGSDENPINPASQGNVPVAILTTEDFDASTVDVSTIQFGPGAAQPVHFALEDVDGDTDWDLVLQFKTQDTGIICSDTDVTLTGETIEGVSFTGTDSIRTVGCK
jgi:hypothetical protein